MKNTKSILIVFLFAAVPVALAAQEIYTATADALVDNLEAVEVSPTLLAPTTDSDDNNVDTDGGKIYTSPGNEGPITNEVPSIVTDKPVPTVMVDNDGSNTGVSESPNAKVNAPINDGKVYSPVKKDVVFMPVSGGAYLGVQLNEVHVITSKEVTPEVQSAISDLKVEAPEIFSPVFSEVTNLVVNPTVEDEKVIYNLELSVGMPIYKDKEVVKPIFDLRVEQPVEFKLYDKKIIISNEQVIEYGEIVSEISNAEIAPPLVQFELHSTIADGKVYDMSLTPEVNSGIFTFIHNDKEVKMPIYSDFKVEDKKLYLQSDNKVHDLKILPQEIYSGVHDLVVKEPKIVIKELSLKVEDEKPIYDLRVEEPFKLFWLFSTKIKSRYIIDPDNGSLIKKKKSWYAFLGRTDMEDDDDIVFLRPE